MELECPHERPIAPVGQWRDDQPPCVSKILVTVRHFGGDHLDDHYAVVEIVAKLADPLEIGRRVDLVGCKLGHDITSYGRESDAHVCMNEIKALCYSILYSS